MDRETVEGFKWRCTVRRCLGKLYVDSTETVILKIDNNHNHPCDQNLHRKVISNNVKRKATDLLVEKPMKLIRTEICEQERDCISTMTVRDVGYIRKNIYRARRKILPPLPKSVKEVHESLASMEIKSNTVIQKSASCPESEQACRDKDMQSELLSARPHPWLHRKAFPLSGKSSGLRHDLQTFRECSDEDIVLNSKHPMPPIPNLPYHEYLFQEAEKHGDMTFIIDGDTDQRFTFRQVLEQSKRASHVIRQRLLRQKSSAVICIFSGNCPEFFPVLLGSMAAGCIPVLVNPSLTWEELKRHLKESRAEAVFACSQSATAAKMAAEALPQVQFVSVFGEDFEEDLLNAEKGERMLEKIQRPPLDSTAAMFFSSGTSGLPKCVQLTHRGLVANLCQVTSQENLLLYPKGSVVLCVLPLAHAYASLALSLQCFATGATVLLLRYDYERTLAAAEKYEANIFPLVPPILQRMLKDEDILQRYPRLHLSSIYSAAASVGQEQEEQFCQKFSVQDFRQILGMTEMSPLISVSPKGHHRPGTVGLLFPGTQLKVIRIELDGSQEHQRSLGPNQKGELLFRGPHVMKGYLDNPEATAQTIDREGWLHSGDVGYYDESGYVYLMDRKKEIIRYKCTQVAPAELEALLMSHPDILDAAVIGVPDDAAGELPRAYVVVKTGSIMTDKDVVKYVADHSASFKHLRGGAVLVPSIPRSPSGKILRRLLRQQFTNHGR